MCSNYSISEIKCDLINIIDICNCLRKGLSEVYGECFINEVDCPDLQESPFFLQSRGICGRPCVVDIGGEKNLWPLVSCNKKYDAAEIGRKLGYYDGLFIGAGASPLHKCGCNGEWVCNMSLSTGDGDPRTAHDNRIYAVGQMDGGISQLPCLTTEFSLLGNLFGCEGKSGKVIEITVRKPKHGPSDLPHVIRSCLLKHYPGKTLAMGGVFLIERGSARFHVMPRKYSEKPRYSAEEIESWLQFYELKAPITCVGILVTNDPGYDLRLVHFHGYSTSESAGGHYHNDVSDDVVYKAYLNMADVIYRVDQPVVL